MKTTENQTCVVKNVVSRNRENLRRYRDQFFRAFGVPLTKMMHPILGFDQIMLDDLLSPEDGTSLSTLLWDDYGEETYNMVRDLIG